MKGKAFLLNPVHHVVVVVKVKKKRKKYIAFKDIYKHLQGDFHFICGEGSKNKATLKEGQ